MKRIRRMAAAAIAALALAGFLSWSGIGVTGGPRAALAISGNDNSYVHRIDPPSVERAGALVEQAQRQQLTVGCNQITETALPVGGKVADWISQNVQPANAVISVWHFDNAAQRYKAAYFQEAAVPVDVPTFTTAIDAFFACVNATATSP